MNELTKFYKLLSDETRIRILMLLKRHKLCVCELCGIMEETQPKISKHLAKLRDLEIIKDERQEQYIFYSLNTDNPLYLLTLNIIYDKLDQFPILKKDFERGKFPEKFFISAKS
jgi:ArsR family transcriptional regulator